MTRPTRIEFGVGRDVYGRQTKLVGASAANGRYLWAIITEPANQRDEGESIGSLTSDQLQELGRIAADFLKAGQ